ncbi:MAG: hypothetical protein K9L26_00170 [Candidatus Izimaplasma sp.]|nr:hypothetical protein [Candidatus Izimaplasma bacterium]
MKKLLGFMTALVLGFALVGCGTSSTEVEGTSLLAVDINPSIEFVLDEDGTVISYVFSNEDAEIAAGNIDFIGMTYEQAIDAFMNGAVEAGYIDVTTTDNTVIITFGNDDEALANQLQTQAEEKAQAFLEENKISGAVLSGQNVYEELQTLADEYDISIGKVRMIQSALATDETLTFEELTELPMNELMALITTSHRERMQEFAQTRKDEALQLQEQMRSNVHTQVNQHQQAVENDEVETPDYDAIRNQQIENVGMLVEAYQQRANQMRDQAIDEVDPEEYMPGNNNNPNN